MNEQHTGLFAELRRRNVFRVGLAYVIAAWLIVQVLEIVLESFGSPAWVMKTVLVVLAAGLPLALIFAWAFELTPEGLKREKDVDRSRSITRQTGRRLDFAIIGVLAVAVGVLLVDRFQTGSGSFSDHPAEPAADQATAESAPVPEETSIAVLPFVNMSSDPEQEYFSDGISEEILNALAHVRELKVAGRTSSFAFKGRNQDLRQIGQTLGVSHILEGSVRKAGDTVRITAQLVQVDDGFHLWSETYDRKLTNVFEIQDEISAAILGQLKAQLIDVEDAPALVDSRRTDTEAYDRYLLAKQRLYERTRLSIEAAVALLDEAIAKDPEYAPAYAQRGIAALLLSERNYGEMTRAEADAESRIYLDKALQLDPQLAEGWAGMGLYHINRPGEQSQGIDALQKALAINPSLIDASNWLHIAYAESGDSMRALEIAEAMVERDPLYPPGFNNAINAYNLLGMQDKSRALLDRVRPFMPSDPRVLSAEAATWLSLGQADRALPLLERAHAEQPSDGVTTNLWSVALLQTAQFDRIIDQDSSPWSRVVALTSVGRTEEAGILAEERAAQGNVGILLWYLARTNQSERLIEFIESRWPDLDRFESEYPPDGSGYGNMLHIAYAYRRVGRAERFDDAMRHVRAAHDRFVQQGVADPNLMLQEARYFTMLGDHDRAIAELQRADASGLLAGAPLVEAWPGLEDLRGLPQFETVQRSITRRMNAERTALGLEPVSA